MQNHLNGMDHLPLGHVDNPGTHNARAPCHPRLPVAAAS